MFSLKIIIIILIILLLIFYFLLKKNKKENFTILGISDELCPNISVIEEKLINYIPNALNKGYFYVNENGETSENPDKRIYYIEERLQPFYTTNIIGIRLSKNYFYVLDDKFNIKYCKLTNKPTFNLKFNYLLEINEITKKGLELDYFGTSYNNDSFAVVYKNKIDNKKYLMASELRNDVKQPRIIFEFEYNEFNDKKIIDIYLQKNNNNLELYILYPIKQSNGKFKLRLLKYSNIKSTNMNKNIIVNAADEDFETTTLSLDNLKRCFNYRLSLLDSKGNILNIKNTVVLNTFIGVSKHSDIFNDFKIDKKYLLTQKSQFIKNETIKKEILRVIEEEDLYIINNDLSKKDNYYCYYTDTNLYSNDKKHFSIINIDESKISNYKPLIQKYINNKNFLIGSYYRVSNNKNENLGDKKKKIYGRINEKKKSELEEILIPSFKFNLLVSENDYFPNTQIKNSLLKYFLKKEKDNSNINRRDWIYIYTALKNAGIYYPNRGKGFQINLSRINSVVKNNKYIIQKRKFNKRHRDLLLNNEFYDVFDYYKNINNNNVNKYPNIFIYEGLPNNNIDYKLILLNFKMDTDTNINRQIENNDKIYLGLTKTDTNNKKEMLDLNRNFFNYSLFTIDHNKYTNNLNDTEKLKFNWIKKKINNFEEFRKLIVDDKFIGVLDLERERTRGLFEIDENLIDEYYIEYLIKIKESIRNNNKIDLEKLNNFIQIQKTKMKNNCTLENNKLINTIGYPFHVIYKIVDKQGDICSIDSTDIGKQKIFLLNNISNEKYITDTENINSIVLNKNHLNQKTNADNDIYKKIYSIKKKDLTSTGTIKINELHQFELNNKNINYPFIKQEFISYTGFGNSIQFYKETMDSIVDIDIASVCRNLGDYTDIIDDTNNCDKKLNICLKNEIGYVNLDGSPKCSLQDPNVMSKNDNNKQLLGIIPQSSCKLYFKLGDSTYYYKFSRVITDTGSQRVQNENEYLIQWIDNGKNKDTNTYLRKTNTDQVILSNYDEKFLDEFKFYRHNPEKELNDIYGLYVMFKGYENDDKYLTVKYNIFNPISLEYSLELLKPNNLNRNIIKNNYLNNNQFYTQKFLLDKSLLKNINENDNIEDKISEELDNVNKLTEQLDNNSNIVETNLSIEEEIKLGKKVNDYLTDNYNDTKEFKEKLKSGKFNIDTDGLLNELDKQKDEIKSSKTNVSKKLEDNTKYLLLSSINNQNMKLIDEKILELEQENQEIIDDNSIGLNSNIKVNKMSNPQTPETENIKKINELIKKDSKNYKPKCNVEGFSNMYSDTKMNKHIIDKYQKYISDSINNTRCSLDKKNKKIKDNLVKIQELSKMVNNNSNYKELKLNEELDKNDDLNRDIFRIKNYEQDHRLEIIKKKIQELKKLRCRLNIKHKKKVDDKYNSIISKEDAELLNVYKLDKCEKKKHNLEDLNLNKILINGGCLTYNQKENNLTSNHCMIGDTNQIFEVEKINSEQDLIDRNFDLENSDSFDKPFYIIKKKMINEKNIKEKTNILEDDKFVCPLEKNKPTDKDKNNNDVCPPDLDKYLCLHKENGALNLRGCENIKNQQWIYSTSSGSCE